MSVNNSYRIVRTPDEKYINLPLEIKWDFGGRQDDLEIYEKGVIEELTASKDDFEVGRYSHKTYGLNNETSITYDFYFYNSSTPVTSAPLGSWVNSYLTPFANPSGFSVTELYYFLRPFRNSFFKLDFYDSPDANVQKNYFTIILPTQQGFTESKQLSVLLDNVNVKKPSIKLDFVGDKEGFFIYWLRNQTYININRFYMSAKFFDAKNGVFVRMMNEPQFSLPDKFNFDTQRYFYYKVVLDYQTKEYEITDYLNVRVGNGTPIKWYEYINP